MGHDLLESSKRAPTPEGFVGALWPPQAAMLHQMIELETRGVIPVTGLRTSAKRNLLVTRAARVGAEFSSGKTILGLSLILHFKDRIKRGATIRRPELGHLAHNDAPEFHIRSSGTKRVKDMGRGLCPRWTATYSEIIPATCVVAASSVISQWETCAREFTPTLRFFTVEDAATLGKFQALICTPGELAKLDIVFVKAGMVTANFRIPGEAPYVRAPPVAAGAPVDHGAEDAAKPEPATRPITAVLAKMTEGRMWHRTITDDFDTIKISSFDVELPAQFAWFMSATQRKTTVRGHNKRCATAAEFIGAHAQLSLLAAAQNEMFDGILRVRCEHEFTARYVTTTVPSFRRVTVEGGRAVALLNALGAAPEIVEMVAAGALDTAAQALGIRAATVGDLVKRVLRERADNHRWALILRERVRRALTVAAASDLEPNSADEAHQLRATLKTSMKRDEVEEAIGRMGPLRHRGQPTPLHTSLHSLAERAEVDIKEHSGRLQRMRDNLKEGECQACQIPVAELKEAADGTAGIYIVNCCQIIICSDCVILGGHHGAGRRFIKRCPNCQADVDPTNDLVYISRDVDLGHVQEDGTLENLVISGEPEATERAESPMSDDEEEPELEARYKDDPRLQAIMQLITGDPVTAVEDRIVPPFVAGLLEGARDDPPPAGIPGKTLIFAQFPEAAKRIADSLAHEGVVCVRLQGKRAQKQKAITEFAMPGESRVMIAVSSRDCAGLHLPMVTRLILYHWHVDPNVLGQAVGRAQRVGREHNLEIVLLLNEGEIPSFLASPRVGMLAQPTLGGPDVPMPPPRVLPPPPAAQFAPDTDDSDDDRPHPPCRLARGGAAGGGDGGGAGGGGRRIPNFGELGERLLNLAGGVAPGLLQQLQDLLTVADYDQLLQGMRVARATYDRAEYEAQVVGARIVLADDETIDERDRLLFFLEQMEAFE